ncbi:MAG: peptidase S8/S53 subtilisin kexin sedolisin, partial [Chlorobi bacterium OLB5]
LNAPPPIGINNIKNSIPKYFVLFQNYPNPFNPVTKIKFQIPSVGTDLRAVSINVYDISGRLVKTILQQNIKPGSYEVSFDGSNLSSGIYIYQLNSGIFSDSKKMVLIK